MLISCFYPPPPPRRPPPPSVVGASIGDGLIFFKIVKSDVGLARIELDRSRSAPGGHTPGGEMIKKIGVARFTRLSSVLSPFLVSSL